MTEIGHRSSVAGHKPKERERRICEQGTSGLACLTKEECGICGKILKARRDVKMNTDPTKIRPERVVEIEPTSKHDVFSEINHSRNYVLADNSDCSRCDVTLGERGWVIS